MEWGYSVITYGNKFAYACTIVWVTWLKYKDALELHDFLYVLKAKVGGPELLRLRNGS